MAAAATGSDDQSFPSMAAISVDAWCVFGKPVHSYRPTSDDAVLYAVQVTDDAFAARRHTRTAAPRHRAEATTAGGVASPTAAISRENDETADPTHGPCPARCQQPTNPTQPNPTESPLPTSVRGPPPMAFMTPSRGHTAARTARASCVARDPSKTRCLFPQATHNSPQQGRARRLPPAATRAPPPPSHRRGTRRPTGRAGSGKVRRHI